MYLKTYIYICYQRENEYSIVILLGQSKTSVKSVKKKILHQQEQAVQFLAINPNLQDMGLQTGDQYSNKETYLNIELSLS